ncbi:MAG: alpha/beta fold hydrolase [Flavisolibacter sp.]
MKIIFLQGLSDSWHSYELVLEHMPNSIRVLALSMRGHGESGKPDVKFSPQDFADDVAAFMKELKIDKAIIVGHSLGSIVAQSFALKYHATNQ